MKSFRLHPSAVRELEEIWDYVAAESISSAEKVINELESACARLAQFPDAGHWRTDIASKRLRFWRVANYLIAYVPDPRPALILGFIHGRRDPKRLAVILKSRIESQD